MQEDQGAIGTPKRTSEVSNVVLINRYKSRTGNEDAQILYLKESTNWKRRNVLFIELVNKHHPRCIVQRTM